MSVSADSIQQLAVNTIRTLSMDAVQTARSGYPGMPMALAPVAYVLFNEQLRDLVSKPVAASDRDLVQRRAPEGHSGKERSGGFQGELS